MLRRLIVLLLVVSLFGAVPASAQHAQPNGGMTDGGMTDGDPNDIVSLYDQHCIGYVNLFNLVFLRPAGVTGTPSYQWNINGTTVPNSNSSFFSYTWATAGTYTVGATVTIGSYQYTTSRAYTIGDCFGCGTNSLAASITATPQSGCIGEAIRFTGRAFGFCFGTGTMVYSWNFGDGMTGSGAVVDHTYIAAGDYTVTLTVSDGLGHSVTATTTVSIAMTCGGSPSGAYPLGMQPGNPTGSTVPVQCRGKAVASINTRTGNVAAVNADPVPTRGFPLTCEITLNSQNVETNRPMGNAAFTYDIHLIAQNVPLVGCTSYYCMVLVDADGSRYPFAVAGNQYLAPRGVFSTMAAGGSSIQVKAGAPGAIDQAGGFVYDFDGNGRLISITDPMGNGQTLTYSGGQLQSVTASNTGSPGKAVNFVWTNGRITQIQHNGLGQLVDLTYDLSGRQTSQITHANGSGIALGKMEYGYNGDGSLQWMQRNGDVGTRVTFTYVLLKDCNNNSVPVCTGATGGTSVNVQITRSPGTQDPNLLYVWVTNAQGGRTRLDFDINGDIVRTVEPAPQGATQGSIVTEYSYNGYTRTLIQVILNDLRRYGYSSTLWGLPASVYNPLGASWNVNYAAPDINSLALNLTGGGTPLYGMGTVTYGSTANTKWLPVKYTDLNSKDWLTGYNAYGQTTQTTAPGEAGAPSVVTNADYYEPVDATNWTGWAKSAWDSISTLVRVNSYDLLGDPTSVSTTPDNGLSWHTATFAYDAAQRLTQATRPDGKTTTFIYTGDNLTSVTGVDNASVSFDWCAHCGLLTGVTAPLGWHLGLTRNSDHQVTQFSDALSHNTNYVYGNAGELKSVTLPDNSSASFFYDNLGRLSGAQTGTSSASLTYDYVDRLSQVQMSKTGGNGWNVTYNYNTDNTLSTITGNIGTTLRYYLPTDSPTKDGSLKDVTDGQGNRVAYTYYANGARKTLTWLQQVGSTNTYNTVASWTYTYDARGRLTGMVATLPGSASETTSYSYDTEDKLTIVQNANGTATEFAYTPSQNFVSSLTHRKGNATFAAYGLTYDSGNNTVGNVTQVVETGTGANSTTTYGYDALYRLTAETRTGSGALANTFGYDLAGNRTTQNGQASTFDAANKIASLPNSQSVQYDADGNQTYWQRSGSAQDSYYYTYDAAGHLVQTQWNQPTPIQATSYGYDGLGRRASRGNTSATTTYVYDGETVIGEVTGGSPSRVFTWGAAGLMSKREISGASWQSRWYHFGASGETRRVTDASGNVTASYSYDAYGSQSVQSGTWSEAAPYGYGGQVGYYDEGNGLYLCGLRWYNPQLGRWLTRDPIGYAGGDNLYKYCGNNPVMHLDPSGLEWWYGSPVPTLDLSDFFRAAGDFLGTVWNSPNTAIGILGSVGADKVDYYPQKNAFVVHGGLIGKINGGFGYTGITFGQIVFFPTAKEDSAIGRAHEFVHIKQGRILGIMYLPATIFGYFQGFQDCPEDPHDGSIMEIWADVDSGTQRNINKNHALNKAHILPESIRLANDMRRHRW